MAIKLVKAKQNHYNVRIRLNIIKISINSFYNSVDNNVRVLTKRKVKSYSF